MNSVSRLPSLSSRYRPFIIRATFAVIGASALRNDIKIPYITSIYLNETGINSYIDNNGIYIENDITGLRSKSYDKESSIPQEVIQYIRKGEI